MTVIGPFTLYNCDTMTRIIGNSLTTQNPEVWLLAFQAWKQAKVQYQHEKVCFLQSDQSQPSVTIIEEDDFAQLCVSRADNQPATEYRRMGNQATRQLSAQRKDVIQSWSTIYNSDPQRLNDAISEAWLKSAELTPTWVWALVDLPETMHTTYRENQQFTNLIQQVRDFLHVLIKVHKCDPDMTKQLAFRLGSRHKHYMSEGNDNAYWAPFAQQLPLSITKSYLHVVNNDSRIRRILRIRGRPEKTGEEELAESWRQFMNMVVESMKRGYEGCASGKTPLRLSITNSIISMASMRSARSRSTSQFLEPNLSPARIVCPSPANTSPVLHCRSRSIFRARPQRSSQDIGCLRRLSSPNNPSVLLTHSDLQLLRSAERSLHADQRRSLTLLPSNTT